MSPVQPSLIRLFLAVFASVFLLSASGSAAPAKNDWAKNPLQTSVGGFLAGSANAPAKIVEYVSYTCPHCAHFETVDMPKIGQNYVATGKANIEIRNYWRDGVDLTMSMLARCGGPKRFFANHQYLMATQQQWRPRASQITQKTASHFTAEHGTSRYQDLDTLVTYMNGVFDEMQLASVIAPMNIKTADARKCLADKTALRQILVMTDDAIIDHAVLGTPGFLFNGTFDATIGDFDTIKARIDRG